VTTSEKDSVVLSNSYRNAIYFDDFLIGQVLDKIRMNGLLKDIIIIITGDHGEEFYEAGNWGHTSDYSKYQSRVSFIMYVPGIAHGEVTYPTSHLDVTQTIFRILGYTTPPSAYSQGKDLFIKQGRKEVVVSGWDDCAIIDPEYTLILPVETYKIGFSQVRFTHDYKLVPDEQSVFKEKKQSILAVLKQMSLFLE
jgi:uncharacterized protein